MRIGADPHSDNGYGNAVAHNRFSNSTGMPAVDVISVMSGATQKVCYTTLDSNIFISRGAGTLVADTSNPSATYRRDASASVG